MTEQEKKGPGRPPNVNFNQDFVEKQDIENIFATVPAGYAIQVHREEPEWCKGYLGKIFCSAEEPINLDMLKNKFGGAVLNLRFVNAQQKFKGSKRVIFPDPPKRDGRVIREGDLLGLERQESSTSPGGGYIPPGLPPFLASQLAAFYAGYPIQPPQPTEQKQNPLEVMQATQIMNMMNAQMEAQQQLMKNNMDHMREMEKIRRDSEDERERRRRQYDRDKPEPMSELQGTIAIIRELNGIKSELGDSNTTTEIISHSAPIIENTIAELLELQKMKVHAEMRKNMTGGSHPPPLPPRQTANHTSQVGQDMSYPSKNGNGKTDPVELARQLRAAYDGLTIEEQQSVMSAFLDGREQDDEGEQVLDQIGTKPQNIGENTNPSTRDLLSDEDREILADDDEQDHSEEIQDGEYPGSTESDDQAHRSSDSERDNVPTD